VDVRTVTVDSLGLNGVRFVKVDVDGEELAALLGASGLLRRDRPALLVELETRIRPIAPVVALLTGQGYRGWVLAARSWMPLADFDLAGHQSRTEHLVHRGLLRRALIPRDGQYIKFGALPAGRTRPRRHGGALGLLRKALVTPPDRIGHWLQPLLTAARPGLRPGLRPARSRRGAPCPVATARYHARRVRYMAISRCSPL
jgi:hypothetical protein